MICSHLPTNKTICHDILWDCRLRHAEAVEVIERTFAWALQAEHGIASIATWAPLTPPATPGRIGFRREAGRTLWCTQALKALENKVQHVRICDDSTYDRYHQYACITMTMMTMMMHVHLHLHGHVSSEYTIAARTAYRHSCIIINRRSIHSTQNEHITGIHIYIHIQLSLYIRLRCHVRI